MELYSQSEKILTHQEPQVILGQPLSIEHSRITCQSVTLFCIHALSTLSFVFPYVLIYENPCLPLGKCVQYFVSFKSSSELSVSLR